MITWFTDPSTIDFNYRKINYIGIAFNGIVSLQVCTITGRNGGTWVCPIYLQARIEMRTVLYHNKLNDVYGNGQKLEPEIGKNFTIDTRRSMTDGLSIIIDYVTFVSKLIKHIRILFKSYLTSTDFTPNQ